MFVQPVFYLTHLYTCFATLKDCMFCQKTEFTGDSVSFQTQIVDIFLCNVFYFCIRLVTAPFTSIYILLAGSQTWLVGQTIEFSSNHHKTQIKNPIPLLSPCTIPSLIYTMHHATSKDKSPLSQAIGLVIHEMMRLGPLNGISNVYQLSSTNLLPVGQVSRPFFFHQLTNGNSGHFGGHILGVHHFTEALHI